MDFFYAPPEHWQNNAVIEITGQEARHILKVLRYGKGDIIHIADGKGKTAGCVITHTSKEYLTAEVRDTGTQQAPLIRKVLGLGLLKARERFEFAVEKAVELGADEICVFTADHSQRSKVNRQRLELQIIAAFKQSGRFWLPDLIILGSLDEVLAHYHGFGLIMAHEKTDTSERPGPLTQHSVLLVGPEGGFSERETRLTEAAGGRLISLGTNRLRAETAAAALLAQYLY